MNKIITIILLSLFTNIASAHDINYEKVILRKWKIENKVIEGSFYLIRDGIVFIEDANNKLVNFPIMALSKDDQEYILSKNEDINQLNTNNAVVVKQSKHQQIFFRNYVILFIILCFFGWYIFSIAEKKKIKYLLPVFTVGICLMLSSFTSKIMQSMKLSSSPASLDSAFAPFKPNINTYYNGTYFYVESKGIPTTHAMMVGISNNGWQRQVPIPQCYIGTNAWPIPLNPILSSNPIPVDSIHFTRGAIAIAVNGVPIFNVHTNTGVDSYLDGQLDYYGGHCGRADDYHYHIAPLHLYNYTASTMPIAYGLDGYAVYGSVEPDGTAMKSLDANHGHLFNGEYHYHGTSSAPYMIARMAGQVTEDNTHQLIPQAAAKSVRPSLTPLKGALITACTPNSGKNGYNVTYSLNGLTDSVVYSWTNKGVYTYKFYTNGNLDSTKNYNGFIQCTVPNTSGINEIEYLKPEVTIIPSPNNGIFYLQLNSNVNPNDVKSISIFNLNGNVIYQSRQFQPNFSLDNITKGIYYIEVKTSQNKWVKKFIVQ